MSLQKHCRLSETNSIKHISVFKIILFTLTYWPNVPLIEMLAASLFSSNYFYWMAQGQNRSAVGSHTRFRVLGFHLQSQTALIVEQIIRMKERTQWPHLIPGSGIFEDGNVEATATSERLTLREGDRCPMGSASDLIKRDRISLAKFRGLQDGHKNNHYSSLHRQTVQSPAPAPLHCTLTLFGFQALKKMYFFWHIIMSADMQHPC